MSLENLKSDDDTKKLNLPRFYEIIKSMDSPPYRTVFTKLNNLTLSHLNSGSVSTGHPIEIEMPYI
jgi:hypothetical protein